MKRTGRLAILAIAIQVLVWPVTSALAKDKLFANATVKTVTASALTVTSDGKDTTFTVDAKTQVVGKGIGTKTAAKGGKATIVDLLAVGDRVTVTHDEANTIAKKVELVEAKK